MIQELRESNRTLHSDLEIEKGYFLSTLLTDLSEACSC